ncbi:uncharacterized protein C7orf57 homolog isoform X1 [Synchiropus splendidus]|uniref:uncharacterized protein C7orf57 homolog isoform X1 n=1 Tax=Synchiropus splendidus TaxID=270530 RepID=UPI00237E65EC|nr:uncharacterized protein C7orf57 homolog isoform X1 [Synchiropus splendidus]
MFSGEPTDFMNNDLPPSKNEDQRARGQLCLMPGMSQNAEGQKKIGRRFGVQEGDSEYIKLAKQGGHKDLLWHGQECTVKDVPSKPAGFFYHAGDDKHQYCGDEGRRNPAPSRRRDPPFGSDNMSTWERDDNCNNYEEKVTNAVQPPTVHFHPQQGEDLLAAQPSSVSSKYKRRIFDKKPAPVDMSKLLSFGYAEDKTTADNNNCAASD